MKGFYLFIGWMVLNTLPLFGAEAREAHILPQQTIAQRILPLQDRFLLSDDTMDRIFVHILSYTEEMRHLIVDMLWEKNLDEMMEFVEQLYNQSDDDMQSDAEEDEVLDEPMDEEKGSEDASDSLIMIPVNYRPNQRFLDRVAEQDELLAIEQAVRREQLEARREQINMLEGELVFHRRQ